MSNALRNTLILASVLVLVLAGGGYWVFGRQRGKIEEIRKEKAQVKTELDALGDVNANLILVAAKLDTAKTDWVNMPKLILPAEDPAGTYAYLNRIMSTAGSTVKLNFVYKGGGGDSLLQWNRYAISEGDATYNDLYGFLWRIENQRRLYRIENFTMSERREVDPDTGVQISRMAFGMDVLGYAMPGTEAPAALGEDFAELRGLKHNPFRPLVYEDIPPNTQNLVEVDKSQLMGITGRTIFIRDQVKKTVELTVGDKVYLGRLVKVDQTRGKAYFSLNKGGVGEDVVLTLGELPKSAQGER